AALDAVHGCRGLLLALAAQPVVRPYQLCNEIHWAYAGPDAGGSGHRTIASNRSHGLVVISLRHGADERGLAKHSGRALRSNRHGWRWVLAAFTPRSLASCRCHA